MKRCECGQYPDVCARYGHAGGHERVAKSCDWERIADDLAAALDSFTAYDGYGQGGAADGNCGDWRAAERAQDAYREAKP